MPKANVYNMAGQQVGEVELSEGVFGVEPKELGLRVLQAPGLPGRTAPVTAAAAIRDAVYHILWELEA